MTNQTPHGLIPGVKNQCTFHYLNGLCGSLVTYKV